MEDYIPPILRGLDSEVIPSSASATDPFGLGNSASSDKFAAFDAYVNKIVDEDGLLVEEDDEQELLEFEDLKEDR